jgi:protein-S-isoprenylcysteine O-methyltransferase Ste14
MPKNGEEKMEITGLTTLIMSVVAAILAVGAAYNERFALFANSHERAERSALAIIAVLCVAIMGGGMQSVPEPKGVATWFWTHVAYMGTIVAVGQIAYSITRIWLAVKAGLPPKKN